MVISSPGPGPGGLGDACGQVLLFRNDVWHAGGVNLAGRTRLAVETAAGDWVIFMPRWLLCMKHPTNRTYRAHENELAAHG